MLCVLLWCFRMVVFWPRFLLVLCVVVVFVEVLWLVNRQHFVPAGCSSVAPGAIAPRQSSSFLLHAMRYICTYYTVVIGTLIRI
jgi:hypothetical protein